MLFSKVTGRSLCKPFVLFALILKTWCQTLMIIMQGTIGHNKSVRALNIKKKLGLERNRL